MKEHDETAIEQLSAYLDGELPSDQAEAVEARLANDSSTRLHLEGLRRVVDGLRQNEPPPPPPTLHHAVAHRIEIERQRVSFLDRVEASLSPLSRSNPLLPMFAVILVLAISVYSLAVLIERAGREDVEVVVVGGDAAATGGHVVGTRLEAANRALFWDGQRWRQQAAPEAADRSVDLDSPEGEALLAAHPPLRELAELDSPALVLVGDEALLLYPRSDPQSGDPGGALDSPP